MNLRHGDNALVVAVTACWLSLLHRPVVIITVCLYVLQLNITTSRVLLHCKYTDILKYFETELGSYVDCWWKCRHFHETRMKQMQPMNAESSTVTSTMTMTDKDLVGNTAADNKTTQNISNKWLQTTKHIKHHHHLHCNRCHHHHHCHHCCCHHRRHSFYHCCRYHRFILTCCCYHPFMG